MQRFRLDFENGRSGKFYGTSLEQLKRNDCFLALTVHPGNGPVVATLIRKMDFPTVFTTIGDDGNVLVVCMSPEAAIKLEKKLNAMLD